nr:fibronectin type III domain-containing protein [Planosporangium mesophilum]
MAGDYHYSAPLTFTVAPPPAPDAPSAVSATAADGSAAVSWTAPADNGGTITSYTVYCSADGAPATPCGSVSGTPAATSKTVTNLRNGATYTFQVSATNAGGPSPRSAQSASVMPSGPSTVTLTGAAVAGQPGTVTATVETTYGYAVDGGSITLSENGRELGQQPVSAGSAGFPVVLTAGDHALTATYSGRPGVAASTASATITVTRTGQTITFGELPALTYRGAPVSLAATSSAGLPVRYTAEGACSVDGAVLTTTDVGRCAVVASQAGDSQTLAAEPVTRTTDVAKAAQSITVPELQPATFGDAPQTLQATATSGLAVTWRAEGSCSVTGTALTGTVLTYSGLGECTVVASQSGDERYEPAADVTRTLVVAAPPKKLALTLNAELGQTAANAPVVVHGSGLKPGSTVTLEVHSTPRTLATGTVGEDGTYTLSAVLPADLEAGNHELIASGIGIDGSPIVDRTQFTLDAGGKLQRIDDRTLPSGLARTGADVTDMVGVAALNVLFGAVLLTAASRRRRQA